MQLLKTQKNELYDLIGSEGLSPSMFGIRYSREDDDYYEYSQCWYKLEAQENGYAKFYFNIDSTNVKFCPDTSKYIREFRFENWDTTKLTFLRWLRALKEEISVVDKWDQLEKELQQANVNFDVGNDKFSHKEHEEIVSHMYVLKQGLIDIPQINENLESINKRLDHLTDMVGELGKFDWRSLFAGTIAGILTQIGATPDNATKLWELVKLTFSTIKLLN